MTLYERLFGNWLDQEVITPTRLANYLHDNIARLTANNPGGAWTPLIAPTTAAWQALQDEVTDVYEAGASRKGKTFTLDQMLGSFKTFMKEEEPFLARALGGKSTPAYIELYPNGVSAYTRATKEDLPTLMDHLEEFATANAAALGLTYTAALQGYASDWDTMREDQLEGKAEVSQNRAERSTARIAAEKAALKVMFTVAAAHPGDEEQCRQWFDFNLLFPVGYLGEEEEEPGGSGD